jgi:hypothetical protein
MVGGPAKSNQPPILDGFSTPTKSWDVKTTELSTGDSDFPTAHPQ